MTIQNCQKHPWITSAIKTSASPANEVKLPEEPQQVPSIARASSVQHSEIKIQILPARITVTDDNGHREEVAASLNSVSSPPLRRPHQNGIAEKENTTEAFSKRFKYREPQLQLVTSPAEIARRASIGSPVHSRVTCK
jgi:hypothetical protein